MVETLPSSVGELGYTMPLRKKPTTKTRNIKQRWWYGRFNVCVRLVAQSYLTLCNLMDYSPPGSSVHGDSLGKNIGMGCHAHLGGNLPNPGIEPRYPTLWMDSLPSEPPGKFTNTGVGSLPLLQGNFLTQESNQGLLHCRQILYQLSYQGSPSWI